jgi:UDP-N-acetylglucosamine 1-carboxyvinyltransferase
MAASLLTEEPLILQNAARVRDVSTMMRILGALGIDASWEADDVLRVAGGTPSAIEAPYDLVRTMRASFMVLGPLLARCGQARVSLPGGCAIGARPVDQHLKGLEALGAKVELVGGYVEARASRLRGGRVVFDLSTVNGTQNVLMAACLAEGRTQIENAAMEPEVNELVSVLQAMGARIEGAGTDRLEVEGVPRLEGATHRVAGDRIEAGTLIVAGAITGGDVEVTDVCLDHLGGVVEKLREIGLDVEADETRVRVKYAGPLRGARVKTATFPGFPTDMQAQIMALLAVAQGSSVITETIFENRFMHVSELQRMGADISVEGRTAFIRGVPALSVVAVSLKNLRASASLLLAGLAARGDTHVLRVYHIDRGYDRIEQKLGCMGARIRRVRD